MHLRNLLTMARWIQSRSSLRLYQHLWELDAGFSQVRGALNRMRRNADLDARELARFRELIAEARAATLSYLLETLGESETKQAGRLFRSRQAREREQDPAN